MPIPPAKKTRGNTSSSLNINPPQGPVNLTGCKGLISISAFLKELFIVFVVTIRYFLSRGDEAIVKDRSTPRLSGFLIGKIMSIYCPGKKVKLRFVESK